MPETVKVSAVAEAKEPDGMVWAVMGVRRVHASRKRIARSIIA